MTKRERILVVEDDPVVGALFEQLLPESGFDLEVAPTAGTVTRVEVDPSGNAPDIDRSNTFWPRG